MYDSTNLSVPSFHRPFLRLFIEQHLLRRSCQQLPVVRLAVSFLKATHVGILCASSFFFLLLSISKLHATQTRSQVLPLKIHISIMCGCQSLGVLVGGVKTVFHPMTHLINKAIKMGQKIFFGLKRHAAVMNSSFMI